MKQCRECGSSNPVSGWIAKGNICKACQRDWAKQHYQDNKQAYLDKAKRNKEVSRARLREVVSAYLANHPCVDCGEADPVVLEFDHRDASVKSFNIAEAMYSGRSPQGLMAEISKCDVRCCNCHRRRTARQLGWWDRAVVYPLATNQLEG